jgi:hypothetical protein
MSKRTAFGRELARLYAGAPLSEVLASVFGSDSAGRAAQALWLSYLATIPTLAVRRQVLAHFLRTFERAQLHGRQWRATGPSTYVGRQHELCARTVEYLDPETGEYLTRPSAELVRRHVPASRAGGLAAAHGRAPRTLNRYRAHLRSGGLMRSAQPPAGAPDATVPRTGDGRWAYAQHWLAFPPTPEMIRRWRTFGKRPKRSYTPPTPPGAINLSAPRADDLRALKRAAERQD